MAIKINVAQKDQEALNRILVARGYSYQRRKFHCTLGFIEKGIPEEEAHTFGQSICHELQKLVDVEPLLYEVGKAVPLFGRVLVFLPTARSEKHLKKLNLWLFHKVQEISEDRWGLNKETLSENYTPHLTLWHTHRPDHRLKKLEEVANTHPTYHLTNTAYVIFN